MTAPMRVQLADQRADRPRWLAVAGVATVGLAGGLLFALAFGRSQHEGEAPELPPSAPAIAASVGGSGEPAAQAAAAAGATGTAPVAIDDVPLQAAVPTLPANVGAGAPIPGEPTAVPEPTASASEPGPGVEPSAVPAASVAAATEPVTAPAADVATEPASAPAAAVTAAAPAAQAPPPTAPSAQHTIVHGQLAYLRCEGVPLESGPYPCPRDRHLERQVWSAIDGLQQCALPALSTPDVELRVELKSRGGKHALEVRPADGSAAFANAALACLTTPLESVRTQLRPIFMVVAFRFEVQ